jgi:hypothetical protein
MMTIADELRKLQELHSTGALTEEEFAQAKAAVLMGIPQAPSPASQDNNVFPIDPTESLTPQRLRTMQTIAGALLVGVVVFLGFALNLVWVQHNGQGMAPPRALPVVSFVAVAMLAICAPLAFVIPRMQTRLALRRILTGTWKAPDGFPPTHEITGGAKLMNVCQTTLIVGLALLQGSAFMGCMAYLLEAEPLTLGVIGVAIVLMLWKFPTERRVRAWLERQAEVLTDLRQQEDSAVEQ